MKGEPVGRLRKRQSFGAGAGWTIKYYTLPPGVQQRMKLSESGYYWQLIEATTIPMRPQNKLHHLGCVFSLALAAGKSTISIDPEGNRIITFERLPTQDEVGLSDEDWKRLNKAIQTIGTLQKKDLPQIDAEFWQGWNSVGIMDLIAKG